MLRCESIKNIDFSHIESTDLDYKVDVESVKPKSWLKSVSAFANTNGGHIIFGVSDKDHKEVGLIDAQSSASKISELIASRISPAPRYRLSEISVGESGNICIDVYVSNGPAYPYYYCHERTREVYVRHGDRSELASNDELNGLILKGQNRTYDSLPTSFKLQDVSFTLLNATYNNENDDELNIPKDLVSMGLLSQDGQVTNGGLLLCDQGLLRQSKIICTRWNGIEKGSIEGDAINDQEFSNASLISLLNNAESFIRNNSINQWEIRGMKREENNDYPYRAVREALVNAMIHRDYQIIGTEIHVDMFDDRMEIVSPGGMMNGSRIQDLDLFRIPSMRRNEIISDLFGRLRFMERRGSGISRIINSYRETDCKPKFYSNELYFLVILPNKNFEFQKTTISNDNLYLEEKNQLTGEKNQLIDKNNQFQTRNINFDVQINIRKTTIKKLYMLFDRYGYEDSFDRNDVATVLGITPNSASVFIKRNIENKILMKEKRGSYRFIQR